jgi:hypothetical protein
MALTDESPVDGSSREAHASNSSSGITRPRYYADTIW